MSEEKQYVEFIIKIPDVLDGSEAIEAWSESLCKTLSESEYSDDFVNNDIIVNYDTPGELYIAASVEFIGKHGYDFGRFFYAYCQDE